MCHIEDNPVVHNQVHKKTQFYICVQCNGVTGMVAQLIRRVVKLEAWSVTGSIPIKTLYRATLYRQLRLSQIDLLKDFGGPN